MIPIAEGHTGLWPRIRRTPRERGLAVYAGGSITDEYGQTWPVADWDAYCERQAKSNLDIYTGPLDDPSAFPFLLEAIAHPSCTVMASADGRLLGISVSAGKYRYWTGHVAVWGADGLTAAFLAALHRLFDYAGVGTYATPAALGEAIWSRARTESVSLPSVAAARDLRENMYGGRADTPGLGRRLAQAFEIDLRSAYVALAARVPCGTAERLQAEEEWMRHGSVTYYAECHCTLPRRERAVGVLPYRASDPSSGRFSLAYPTAQPKQFTSWLWREEVQRARRAGTSVVVGRGWFWRRFDRDNRRWIDLITALRREAPDAYTEQMLKLASVAAIGRHGRAPVNYSIIWADDPRLSEGDIPLPNPVHGEAPITGAWLHREPDPHPRPRLPHWFNYITMKCRIALYDRMVAERRAGNAVLMTNFDSILLEQASQLPTGEGIGDWRQTRLTNVRIVAPRSFTSDQKIRLPGVPLEGRE